MIHCVDIIEARKRKWDGNLPKDQEFTNAIAYNLLSPENRYLVDEIQENPEYLIEMVFYIVNKETKTVPFFLNNVQKSFLNDLRNAIGEHKAGNRRGIKLIVLKGRQQGFTSFITAYQLAATITQRNFSGMTVADSADNTATIFEDKARFPYSLLPDPLKPSEKFNNRKELHFDILNSRWRCTTAGSEGAGRSKTINFFHGSEVGFWPDYEDTMTALQGAFTTDCIQILETTANGYNEFKKLWDDAMKSENNWKPKFYEWWRTSEYRTPFVSKEEEKTFKESVLNPGTDFHRKLKVLLGKGLSWEQLNWYSEKRKDLKDKLPQEYPCNPEEAFLSSGNPYFDIVKIEELLLMASPSREIHGLAIFEEPKKKETYVIGCDVAEGLEEGDFSHAKVFKASSWEEVAYLHGHWEPDVFGDKIVDLAEKYNNAFVAVERNNHGHSTLATIYRYRKYRNIFMEKADPTDRVIIPGTSKKTSRLGWLTNAGSKFLMLDELDTAIRNDEIYIRDIETLRELREVVTDEKGNVSINGKDRVAATAIAWQMRKFYSMHKAKAVKSIY
jgi:hypothetical protein